MPVRLPVEELVINDSFINYCLERNEQDVLYWDQYGKDYPDQLDTIEEARQLVFFDDGCFNRYRYQFTSGPREKN